MINDYNEVKKKLKIEINNLFEEFWDIYPRKIGKAKCVKKFTNLCRDIETGKLIIEGLKKYNNIYSTRARKYIPHPSTWLNEERWLDDIESEYEEIF